MEEPGQGLEEARPSRKPESPRNLRMRTEVTGRHGKPGREKEPRPERARTPAFVLRQTVALTGSGMQMRNASCNIDEHPRHPSSYRALEANATYRVQCISGQAFAHDRRR